MSRHHAARTFGLAVAALALWISPGVARAQEADLASLRAATKASPTDPAASLALGRALRRAGRTKEAVAELGRGVLLPAASAGGADRRLRYELARVKIDQRDLPGALAACKALPGAPALVSACRAEAHLFQNRATEAHPDADRALALEPRLYEGKVALGRALGLEAKPAEAESAFREAIAIATERPEAHLYLGVALLAQGKRAAALESLKKARAADPGDPEIALLLGEALGRTREGKEALTAAVTIRPTFAAAHAQLALTALELGELAVADSAAAQAAKLDGKLFAARVARGRVLLAQSKWDAALAEGEAARKIIPNAAAGDLIVADAHAGKGDIDLAVEAYQKAFGLDRADPAPLVRAARACTAAGRLTTARGFADKATMEFPTWGPAWVELGEAAARQGDKPKARSAYQTALGAEGPVDREHVKGKLASLK